MNSESSVLSTNSGSKAIRKTGVLIVNLGTPDSPSVPDVRKYLREFLMDERVIDIPFINRWLLINFIIAPFRAPKSAKIYRELWQPEGSPLKFHGYSVEEKLQKKLGDKYVVKLAMRYQSPSIESALTELRKECFTDIIIIPFFPQYASASTGSVYKKVMEVIKDWEVLPELRFVNRFLDHPKFIKAFADLGKKYLADGDTLLHGDYYPGSWLFTEQGIKIIDPEFCFYGRAEFDVAVMKAHLMMAKQRSQFTDNLFEYYNRPEGFDDNLFNAFTGMEIIRRIIGLAQLPLALTLQQKEQLLNEAVSLLK